MMAEAIAPYNELTLKPTPLHFSTTSLHPDNKSEPHHSHPEEQRNPHHNPQRVYPSYHQLPDT